MLHDLLETVLEEDDEFVTLAPVALEASSQEEGEEDEEEDDEPVSVVSLSDEEAEEALNPAAIAPEASTYQAEEMPEGTSVVAGPKRRRWYIIHTYSGHENKVKLNLERRIESMNMAHKIFRVEVPQKPVTKIKDGKRIEKDENLFPGYVLVEMMMDDDSWYVVRYTPGVSKFVGGEKKPIAARESEIKRILYKQGSGKQVAKVEIDLKAGDSIEIVSGPFQGFDGTVTEVNAEKEKLKATVSIFGRETPVELVFSQIQKVS